MCEEAYSGCPSCHARTENIRSEATVSVSVSYDIDDDGDPVWGTREEWDSDEEYAEFRLYCTNCGECDFRLETDIAPEDCDCDECQPPTTPPLTNYADEWLTIERVNDRPVTLPDDTPPEIHALYRRRTLRHLPVRVDRATVVMDWVERNLPDDHVFMRLTTPHPAHRHLAVPEPATQPELEVTA